MSTNYYWAIPEDTRKTPTGEKIPQVDSDQPQIHVCKMNGNRILWVQSPEQVIAACIRAKTDLIIRDEYGRAYTGEAFLVLLSDPENWDRSTVGRYFS